MNLSILISFCLALGLSAACGLRIFIPPLAVGIFSKTGFLELGDSWDWLSNDWIIAVLLIACIIEVCASLIPWLNNFMDLIATPAAIIAGTILAFSSLDGLDPGLQWILAVICGVVVTTPFQLSTVSLRALSTTFSGGLASPVFGVLENLMAIIITLFVLLIPIASLFFIFLLGFLINHLISSLRKRRRNLLD
tara:strand:+ start:1552 stop:2130 length:579 start_codon:yes stop_codon:yes gene_type:complete